MNEIICIMIIISIIILLWLKYRVALIHWYGLVRHGHNGIMNYEITRGHKIHSQARTNLATAVSNCGVVIIIERRTLSYIFQESTRRKSYYDLRTFPITNK